MRFRKSVFKLYMTAILEHWPSLKDKGRLTARDLRRKFRFSACIISLTSNRVLYDLAFRKEWTLLRMVCSMKVT